MNFIKKILLRIAILLVGSTAAFFFIIQPTIIDIKTFNERIEAERLALENKYASRRNIKIIINDLKYISANLPSIEEKMLVKKGDEVAFINQLEKIAQKNNLTQKISLGVSEEAANPARAQKYNLTVSLSGGYLDILKYLSDLEKAPIYIIIKNINIVSGKSRQETEAASSGVVKTNLSGYVYFSI